MFDLESQTVYPSLAQIFCDVYRDEYDYDPDKRKWLKYFEGNWTEVPEIMIRRVLTRGLLPKYQQYLKRLEKTKGAAVKKETDPREDREVAIEKILANGKRDVVNELIPLCKAYIQKLKNPSAHSTILRMCKTIFTDRIDFLE